MKSIYEIQEPNITLTFQANEVEYFDNEEGEGYSVIRDDVERLARAAEIPEEIAGLILGRIEQLRIGGSAKRVGFRPIEPAILIWNLTTVLQNISWRELYRTLQAVKYYQVKELCTTDYPMSYYQTMT